MLQPAGTKMYTMGAIGVGVLGVIFSLLSATSGGLQIMALLGGLMALIGSAGAVLLWKYGYLVIPFLTQRARIVMITDTGYEIPPEQDVIVKNENNVYYASSFLVLKIYESATEKSQDEAIAYNQFFERAISNIKYVTKISYMLYVEDVGEKRKSIETKKAEAQLRLSREREKSEADVLKLDRFEREVQHYDMELSKLIKGVKPMGVLAYAMTTAAGISKESAIATARTQANELRTVLANALNVEVLQLTGDEMLKCFEWDKFYPTSPKDLEEAVF
ncbi:MAG: hypothetical protein V1492_02770 [Candidatus Micrarchaeota archaeon]